jgi:hypothetical protein
VAWAPDSRQIAFASDRNGPSSVYRKAIDAVDEELLLRIPGRGAFPKDWSADGRCAHTRDRQRDGPGGHLGALARRRSHAVSAGPIRRQGKPPRLSHDGRLVAFESDESGATEIYVAPFGKTAGAGSRPVVERSRGGGPMGGSSSSRHMTGDVMAAAVKGSEPLETAPPVRLFHGCGGSPRATGERRTDWFEARRRRQPLSARLRRGECDVPIVVSVTGPRHSSNHADGMISFSEGQQAVRPADPLRRRSFQLNPGEKVGLVGPTAPARRRCSG